MPIFAGMNSHQRSVHSIARHSQVPLCIYVGIALVGCFSLGAKLVLLEDIWRHTPDLLKAWQWKEYVSVIWADICLYWGLRFFMNLIEHLSFSPSKNSRNVLRITTVIVLCVSVWYLVSSAHYFLVMGDFLTLPVLIAFWRGSTDLGKAHYLGIREFLFLFVELSLSVLFFLLTVSKLKPLRNGLKIVLSSERITVWGLMITLIVRIFVVVDVEAYTFNLEKNALIVMVSSGLTFQRDLKHVEYDFPVQPQLVRRSKYGSPNLSSSVEIPTFQPGDKPNVILFVMESAGARHLSIYDGSVESMPNLSALKKHAVFFERAYGHSSNSISAVPSFFCSMYPHPSKWSDQVANADFECNSLQNTLKKRGYATAVMSRWNFDHISSLLLSNGVDYLRSTYDTARRTDSEESLIQYSMDWAEKQSTPFFLTIWPIPAHTPGVKLEPRFERFHNLSSPEENEYHSQLFYQDYLLGEMVRRLKADRLFDNSVLVLMGDHGEGLGRVGRDFKHSNFLYEDIARIPLLIIAPRIFDREIDVASTIQQIDVVPTLLGLLGLEDKEFHQGRDFTKSGNRTENIVYMVWGQGRLLALADGHWKYILNADDEVEQLYDLESDPLEHKNLSSKNKERANYYNLLVKQFAMYQQNLYKEAGALP